MDNVYTTGNNIKFEFGEKHMDTRRSNNVHVFEWGTETKAVCVIPVLLFETVWSEHLKH